MTTTPLTILLIGGYGTFGRRIVDLLRDIEGLRIIVAGRSLSKAQAFCATPATAELIPTALDIRDDLEAQLAALAPGLVVDAAGPFQAYGADPYRLARTTLSQGIDYLDLADGRAFVTGISELDAAARQASRFALSGVSTVPALSSAVIRHLSQDLTNIDDIEGGISPAGHVPMGLSVIQGLTSYAGGKTPMLDNGIWKPHYCLTDGPAKVLAIPGQMPLAPRRFGRVDVPDLDLIPKLYPSLKTMTFTVGIQPGLGHWLVRLSAWLVRLRVLPSLRPFARLMQHTSRLLKGGEPIGGMYIRVDGDGNNGRVQREWVLTAQGDDGPNIPALAVAALVQRLHTGWRPAPGARACTQELELDNFASLFARFKIDTGVWEEGLDETGKPLYQRLLNSAFGVLPPQVQAVHQVTDAQVTHGVAQITRGRGIIAPLIAALFKFPKAGVDVPVTVTLSEHKGVETWTRQFGDTRMTSTLELGKNKWAHLLIERFGPFAFGLAVTVTPDLLEMHFRRWSVFGVPLPRYFAPISTATERVVEGRFEFDVAIELRLIGRLVHYRGWLEIDAADQ